jgi:hypothetical protein
MSYLESQIEEITQEAIKQIEYGKTILNILDSLDLSPRCSAINNEHLYSAAELESILKIRKDKKEQFQHLLDISMEGKRINLNTYYSLPKLLEYLPTLNGLASLTYYCDERGCLMNTIDISIFDIADFAGL